MNNMGIKGKLCIIVLLTVIPFALIQIVNYNIQEKSSIQYQLKECEDTVEAVTSAFMNYLECLWDTELTIGMAGVSNGALDREYMEKLMKDVLSKQRAVKRYNIVGMDGRIIASTIDIPSDINLGDKEYIKKVAAGEEKVVWGIVQSRIDNDIIMPVARGIWKDGKLVCIIVADVDVNKLGEYLPGYSGKKKGYSGIIDNNGMLVYINNNSHIDYEGRRIDKSSPMLKALKGEVVKTEYGISNVIDSPFISVSVPIPEIGWACFDALSMNDIRSWYKNQIRYIIIIFLTITITYLPIVLFIIRQMLKPLNILKDAFTEIFDGNLSVRTNLKGRDTVAEAGRAFDNMAERLELMEANRNLFLQTSAHELRNPITSIKGIASLIRMKVDAGRPIHEITNMIEIMEREVDRLSDLLTELLEAFKTQKKEWEFKTSFKKVNIIDVVISAMRPFQAGEMDHFFILDMPPSRSIYVFGDSARLGDVMRNLFSNAVKYSPSGSIVNVKVEQSENHALISVSDRGIGIPESQLSRIFESFYRASNIESNDPGGMGLGLYICKDIIKRHGGSIWAKNNDEGGSTFYVELPLYK